MSVVKINAIEVPEGMGERLEERFAARAGEVDQMPGFEAFELLRPSKAGEPYYVYTRWESDEAFTNWLESRQFQQGHARSGEGGPVGTGSRLLSFEVVMRAEASD